MSEWDYYFELADAWLYWLSVQLDYELGMFDNDFGALDTMYSEDELRSIR